MFQQLSRRRRRFVLLAVQCDWTNYNHPPIYQLQPMFPSIRPSSRLKKKCCANNLLIGIKFPFSACHCKQGSLYVLPSLYDLRWCKDINLQQPTCMWSILWVTCLDSSSTRALIWQAVEVMLSVHIPMQATHFSKQHSPRFNRTYPTRILLHLLNIYCSIKWNTKSM